MGRMPVHKYRPYPPVELPERHWPARTILGAPLWCTVDLRDGNQALVDPMRVEEKLVMYQLLLEMGFREIEVGFPSSSQIEYDFTRMLIEEELIPARVTIQVLTQARDNLIDRTFKAIVGAERAIVHLYNSTSELQRRVVFRKDRKEIVALATKGARIVRDQASLTDTRVIFEYSPESFTGTELDFAVEICEAVAGAWGPSPGQPMIVNLPATVEMSTPNIYADQIEWFLDHIACRESIILSVHPHNDRGTAVAATELALLAGAQRVEGTLFGNGERTGNVDLITLALNMASQGVDPGLNLRDIDAIARTCMRCTNLPVHPRHPYGGELVYTAFSGSHQDAISKGMKAYKESAGGPWEVPYLPIDPTDVGRTYESIIRINSQSGKGGIAYVMEKEHGMLLPRGMHAEFAAVIQEISDASVAEVNPKVMWEAFASEYLDERGAYTLGTCTVTEKRSAGRCGPQQTIVEGAMKVRGRQTSFRGTGKGPVEAFAEGLRGIAIDVGIEAYAEHALATGSDSKAAAYVQVEIASGVSWGVGIDQSIDIASFKAIVSGLNRLSREGPNGKSLPA